VTAHRDSLNVAVLVGVGGAFAFHRGCRSMDSIFPCAALASSVRALSAAVRLRQRISDAARRRRAARQLEVRDRYCRGR
jgi:hypothetical protein